MMFDAELESMPRGQLRRLQDERLQEMVSTAYEQVPFYRQQFDEAGVKPADIRSVEELPRLPLTRKTDLRDNYPFGLLAVPRERLARVHASSGTTGKPTVVGYTKADLDVFAQAVARCLAMGGARPGMMLHNVYGYGLFTGGLGLHYGGERLGMSVVPVSAGMTDRQVLLLTDFRPDVISGTPSYLITLAQALRARGIEPEQVSLRHAFVGAEPWTDTMRTQIDQGLGLRCTNIYGLSEIAGPGLSNECIEARDGSHINEDHFYPEIVDAETGEPLPDGAEGVLVFTTLTKEAMPLLRYSTSDITSLTREPCRCGRTLVRMGQIKGRADDMLIIRGVNLYPTQVEVLLGRFAQLTPHYQLVVSRDATLDVIEVRSEVTEEFFREVAVEVLSAESIEADHKLRRLRDEMTRLIREHTGLSMTVTLEAPGSLPRSEGGKMDRVRDLRTLT